VIGDRLALDVPLVRLLGWACLRALISAETALPNPPRAGSAIATAYRMVAIVYLTPGPVHPIILDNVT
jgi:hypothetical protein